MKMIQYFKITDGNRHSVQYCGRKNGKIIDKYLEDGEEINHFFVSIEHAVRVFKELKLEHEPVFLEPFVETSQKFTVLEGIICEVSPGFYLSTKPVPLTEIDLELRLGIL